MRRADRVFLIIHNFRDRLHRAIDEPRLVRLGYVRGDGAHRVRDEV